MSGIIKFYTVPAFSNLLAPPKNEFPGQFGGQISRSASTEVGTDVKPGSIMHKQRNLDNFVKVFMFVCCAGFVQALCR